MDLIPTIWVNNSKNLLFLLYNGIEDRKKYVIKFRTYKPSLDDHFEKPKSSGRKPNEQKHQKKPEPDLITDRLQRQEFPKEKEKQVNERSRIQFKDPDEPRQIIYQLHVRSMVPISVKKCRRNCAELLVPGDKENYLLVKSFGKCHCIDKNGKRESKYGPLYVRFRNQCLKEYTNRVHQVQYDSFPYNLIEIDKETLLNLSDDVLASLLSRGIEIPWFNTCTVQNEFHVI